MARENKTQVNDTSARGFVESVDDEQQRADSAWLIKTMVEVTGTQPTMWGSSIIGFGDNSYTTADSVERDWFHVGFSPRKGKLSLYLMTGFNEYADSSGFDPKPFLDKLGPHSTGKSCLYIKRLDDINRDVLRGLIKASYEHSAK